MKPFSGKRPFLRIFVWTAAIIVALGFYGQIRAQSAQAGAKIVIPLRPLAPLSSVPIPEIFGIEGILADKAAAIKLGKALFWDMQAGSDDIQACASCHFNAGADSRGINSVNPGQAGGDNSFQLAPGPNHQYTAGNPNAGFGGYHDGDFPFHKLSNPNDRGTWTTDVNDVSGSQGVFATSMLGIVFPTPTTTATSGGNGNSSTVGVAVLTGGVDSGIGPGGDGDIGLTFGPDFSRGSDIQPIKTLRAPRNEPDQNGATGQELTGSASTSVESTTPTPDPVFSYPDPGNPGHVINTRKVTGRNTPSVVDAVFNFRNFWDGRAQNICNGSNPFGSRDQKSHLMVMDAEDGKLGPAIVAMKNSAL